MIGFQPYGLIISLGIIAAGLVILKQAKKEKIKPEIILDCGMWGFIGGIIGARLYHVFDFWNFYSKNPLEIFKIWQGGLGIFGGIFGGTIGLLAYSFYISWKQLKRKEIYSQYLNISMSNFFKFADISAIGIPLAQAIGRWGNFVNQELYGLPTNLPWAIYIKPENRLDEFNKFSRFHPLFLYESLWNLLVFFIIFKVFKTFKKRLLAGEIFILYLSLYSFGRFWLEFLRPDSWKIYGIRTAQLISLVTVFTSGFLLFIRRKSELFQPRPRVK